MHILIVDDHPLALQGMRFCLDSADFSVSTAHSFEDALEALKSSFDVLLLDYHLSEHNAFELLNFKNVCLPEHVLIISGMSDPEDIAHCLALPSVSAFFSKQSDLSDLISAIKILSPLDKSLSWVWDNHLHTFVQISEAFPDHAFLSPKEREVFMLLRKGLQDKQIADVLCRSIHTIRVQIRAIKRKRSIIRRHV